MNNLNIDFAKHSIYFNRDLDNWRTNIINHLVPLEDYEKIALEERLLFESELETHDPSALNPSKDEIGFAHKTQRHTRLAEGEYEIFVPKRIIYSQIQKIIIPPTNINVTHYRTTHPDAEETSIDEILKTRDLRDNIIKSKDKIGIIESLRNFQVLSEEISALYSLFTGNFNAPKTWDQAEKVFKEIYEKAFIPYFQEVNETIRKVIENKREDASKLIKIIAKKDEELFNKHQDVIREIDKNRTIAKAYFFDSLTKLDWTYLKKLNGIPMPITYQKENNLLLDGNKKIISGSFLDYDRPILKSDFSRSSEIFPSRIPLNEKFHDELRKELGNKINLKPYEIGALNLIREAYYIGNKSYESGFVKAQSAFELALNNFLIENNVFTEEEIKENHITLRNKMGKHFDEAVKNIDPSLKGRNYFDRSTKAKIIDTTYNTDPTLKMTEIRNKINHITNIEEARYARDIDVATIGINVYKEGIMYILNNGWEKKADISKISDILSWNAGKKLKGVIKVCAENEAVDHMKKNLEATLDYIQEPEVANLLERAENMNPKSWALDTLKQYYENNFKE